MTSRSKSQSLLAIARRLNRSEGPIFLTIENNPEVQKLRLLMASNRQAMIGRDHYEAAPDETTEAFHARLRKLAKARGAWMVQLGHPSNALRPLP
jgi:hypothetical protein